MRWLVVLFVLVVAAGAQAQYPWGYAPYPPGYQPYPPAYPTYPPAYAPYGGSMAPPPAPGRYSTSLARAMVEAHNAVRHRVGVPPVVWSSQLAAAAQNWASSLIASHRFGHSGGRYGENVYTISGAFASPDQVVTSWAEEGRGYNIYNNSCVGMCGHYTQIVWRTTRGIGCAVASDASREVWVCEYDPPGNVVGQRPY